MKEIEQIQQIVNSLVRIGDKRVSEAKIDLACVLNGMSDKAEQFAQPSAYSDGYKDAVEDVKRKMGIKNTLYELFGENPQKANMRPIKSRKRR